MKIVLVIPTFNRSKDLKEALERYDKQTLLPEAIIVVNNGCTDNTQDFLDEWQKTPKKYKKIVVVSDKNLGGSGGFYLGMKKALKLDFDFIFLADDDAFADKDSLLKLCECYQKMDNKNKISGLCSEVINIGKVDVHHRRRIKKGMFMLHEITVPIEEYENDSFEIDEFTFVGALIKKSVIERIGLPERNYFIHYDDTEYAIRMRKYGKIICVPSSVMYHNTGFSDSITWKDYYGTRNQLDLIKKHYESRYYYSAVAVIFCKKASLLAKIYKGRTDKERRMFKQAIKDARNNKLGISEIYKPGTRIN